MKNNETVIKHSKKTMGSYGTGAFIIEFSQGVLNFMLFYYYEVEIGLLSWMTGLGLAIYALWDAFNDPLIGYLTDRPFGFTKKWGRRFPWIVIGYIPMLISFVLLFSPPDINAQEQPWAMFGWLVFTTCLFDTCESVFTCNYNGLFPDKFRGEERVKASGISVYIGIIGVVFANLLPPIIIVFGDLGTYALMAWICVSICFIAWFFMLPGSRDDKEGVENYLTRYEEQEKEPFFKTMKGAFKQKSFLVFLLLYIAYQANTTMVQASFLYWIRFIIYGDADDVLYVMVMLLIGVMVVIPILLRYNKKKGDNRKSILYAGVFFISMTFLFSLVFDLTILLIVAFLWGLGLGSYWLMMDPVYSDVIDESIARTGVRREGFYMGFRSFMSNLSRVIQSFFFAGVHELTGFVENAVIQIPSANTGILLLFGVIPAIITALGLIIFWRFYDITPEKALMTKEKLMELKI